MFCWVSLGQEHQEGRTDMPYDLGTTNMTSLRFSSPQSHLDNDLECGRNVGEKGHRNTKPPGQEQPECNICTRSITSQYEELGFSRLTHSDERGLYYQLSLPHLYILNLGMEGLIVGLQL